jgi:NADPH-dependent 2,4-dienoyl-CoA reductase/sulfur reductase-like enzyme
MPATKDTSQVDFPKVIHETIIVDGVLRYPPTGTKVVIVGGGPGGYHTALECWRKGHDVELLEKNEANTPIGMWQTV